MAQWASASSTNNIEHSSLDVNLADFDPSYDPAYDLEANCPMCRTHTTASPDEALARQLEKRYPAVYAERRMEEEVERGSRVGEGGGEGVMILIGNKHRLERDVEESECQHDWTFFVRTSRPDLVKEVRVNLHPTFRPPRVTLTRLPYEVRRLGWGWFTIEAEIVLKEPYRWIVDTVGTTQSALELTWTLDFEGRGRQGRVRTKVKKLEEVDGTRGTQAARAARRAPELEMDLDDAEDEEDDDYEAPADNVSSEGEDEDEDEDMSEYIETPRR